ncbi:MAG TPA: penicillin-binding protein 2 [Stellaceae bacterium]|nr:penicillin-binding protein 2 [Stellaceae bacterium]
MVALPRFDDNPSPPRHFKPPPYAPLIPHGPTQQALETARTRLVLAAAVFVLLFVAVAGRAIQVMLFGAETAGTRITQFHIPSPPVPDRVDIVDRNGRLLATSLDSPSLYADPRQVLDPAEAVRKLMTVFPALDRAALAKKLTSGKSFIWIKRRLTPRQEAAVNALGIPGLQFDHEKLRVYPYGNLLAHVVGYEGIDNHGFAGIERAYDGALKQRRGPLQLALDVRLQYILRDEVAKVIQDFTAIGGGGIIMNVNTGEILAMVSLPDFDPNHPERADPNHPEANWADRIFNRMTLGDYEVGSVFKTFTMAMGLDSGAATMTSRFDAIHNIHIGRFTISDYHGKHRMLTVPEIYMYSSNLGSARMALAVGAQRQEAYLRRFGLLSRPQIDLKELGMPHYPHDWREVNVMTIGFGHGISETPVQVAAAASAMVNGGILRPASVLKLAPDQVPPGRRVISPRTSEQMRQLLRLVVEYGTARFAEVPGYVVGGKTGTAEKVVHGVYARHKLLSDFIAAFPMNNPQYLIYMMVDEPHGNKASHGYATAGWTVVPATGRVIARIAPLLGVKPVDEASAAIVDALTPKSMLGQKIEDY